MPPKYFEPFTVDQFIPSIGIDENGEAVAKYTRVDKDLFNEAVLSGIMSTPACES
jgi:hypothetical protein